ncbi:hypothetical protein RYZ20_01575 [Thioclava sp. A2]|uniref:Kelch repeat-containing protein n=1 Tax=Thioclava sp. FCG-A2 TaxID=3080562 RepID=UPI0029539939|nr:hypothetical protein [Thioclava sp. A2]MDV7269582.1 hypothetical protein [Thioclava sp. A2]
MDYLTHGIRRDIALDATLETYDVEMLKLLIGQGADVHQITDISPFTENPERIRDAEGNPAIRAYIAALLEAGWTVNDLEDLAREQIRFVTEAYLLPKQAVKAPGFRDGAGEVRGKSNPEERTRPFYLEMLRTGDSSYNMQQRFPGLPDVIWTADRFGQSTTQLEDGRWVQIGGEHEDHYMSEFVIFNDVTVYSPDAPPRIFFYPTSIFPPTDFHSATLVGDTIWIVGGLGYSRERRSDTTPVYCLALSDFSITKIDTTGEFPGWIHRHQAKLTQKGIVVIGGKTEPGYQDNRATYLLNLEALVWEKVSRSGDS